MEAINSLASTAAKTIWGENNQQHGEEPVSGKQGDTSKGEPYDAGNIEPTESSTDTTSPITKTDNPSPAQTKDTMSTTTTTNPKTDDPSLAQAKDSASTTAKTDCPSPAKAKDSSVMAGDSTKAQNDTRSPEEAATVSADELKGPGPRPVAEVAREHGGDAGAVSHETGKGSGMLDGSDVPAAKPGADDTAHAAKKEDIAAETDAKDHKDKDKEEGTGEEYIKSSGLKADGGDFDATKPGAGREADRLMGEKGIHHVPGAKPEATAHGKSAAAHTPAHTHAPAAAVAPAASTPETKEKKSLSDRIKAKLHHKSGSS